MNIQLLRTYHEKGTNGRLLINGQFTCHTIELPWHNNLSNISCIPEGRYPLARRYTAKKGHHLLVNNTANRYFILVHAANNALTELHGCIAPVTTLTGPGRGDESRKACVLVYQPAFAALGRGEEVWLEIGRDL